jgi:hypothetical protein
VYHLLYAGTVEQQLYGSTLAKQELFERVRGSASTLIECEA